MRSPSFVGVRHRVMKRILHVPSCLVCRRRIHVVRRDRGSSSAGPEELGEAGGVLPPAEAVAVCRAVVTRLGRRREAQAGPGRALPRSGSVNCRLASPAALLGAPRTGQNLGVESLARSLSTRAHHAGSAAGEAVLPSKTGRRRQLSERRLPIRPSRCRCLGSPFGHFDTSSIRSCSPTPRS